MSDPFGDTVDPLVKAMNRAASKASRDAVIEECAQKLEAMHGMFNGFEAAAAIRALKDKL